MKKREGKKSTLFDFIETTEAKQPQRQRDISEEIYKYIKSRGFVKKEELFKWARDNGFTTAEFFKAVEKLVTEKKIKKRLDDEGSLIYEVIE
ncbi:MAG: hypothetical protein QXR18_10420 [Pyrobaculum sp.]